MEGKGAGGMKIIRWLILPILLLPIGCGGGGSGTNAISSTPIGAIPTTPSNSPDKTLDTLAINRAVFDRSRVYIEALRRQDYDTAVSVWSDEYTRKLNITKEQQKEGLKEAFNSDPNVKITDIQALGDSFIITDSGHVLQRFTLRVSVRDMKTGEQGTVELAVDFMWANENGEWKIIGSETRGITDVSIATSMRRQEENITKALATGMAAFRAK
jgi:hypothetical protein